MKLLIHNIPTEIFIQTISLSPDWDNLDNSFLFRCHRCGTTICRVKGKLTGIVPGVVPAYQVPAIFMCYNCRENYVFQSVFSNIKVPSVTLSPQPNMAINSFRCVVCRTPLLEYDTEVFPINENKPLKLPKKIECPKLDCKREYLISDIVSL